MTSINDLYPSKYLKASDVDNTIATIDRVEQEQVGQKREVKNILYFSDLDKPMVLNKTNANMIAKLHGPEIEDWYGKRIMLVSATVEFQGESVDAIRVKPARTKPAPQRAVPRHDPISTGPQSDFPGDHPMPKRRAAIDQDLDDDIEF